MPSKTTKAGTSKASAAERRALFVQAYMANGHNATQAAITAGYSEKTAHSKGAQLLREVKVSGALSVAAKGAWDKAQLSADGALREVAGMAFGEVGEPLTHANKLKALDMLFKHLGLFERDNTQKGANLAVQINFVGTDPDGPRVIEGRKTD